MENLLEKLKEYWKIILLASLAVLAGGIFYLITQHHQPVETLSATALPQSSFKQRASQTQASTSLSSHATIMVDLKGAVVKPAVYKLAADDRVDDLIKMAGGFTSDADQKTVNLAAKLKDEEVIDVAKIGETPPLSNGQEASSTINTTNTLTSQDSTADKKVDINSADLAELETLNGIGDKKAQDIIDYRTKNGPFQTLDDLGNVAGFGDKTLEKLKDSICFD